MKDFKIVHRGRTHLYTKFQGKTLWVLRFHRVCLLGHLQYVNIFKR